MSCIRRALAAAAVVLCCVAHAAEKAPATTNQPPKLIAAIPFAIVPGTNHVVLRGLNLTNATAVRVPGSNQTATAKIVSRGKAAVPDKADAKKVGDTQIEVLLTVAEGTDELSLCVSTPEGESNTNSLRVIKRERLVDEKEQNGSLRKPQAVRIPQSVRGAVDPAMDVDVYRFEAVAGQEVHLETFSTRYGSSLDPVLTVYDASGHVLATSDDSGGTTEARILFKAPKDGAYCVSIIDAHDRGGAGFGYLLEIR